MLQLPQPFYTTERRCRSDLAVVAMTSEEDHAAEIIERIVARVIQDSVPLVQPQEQSVVPLPEATELAEWAATIDKDKLNAYMDNKFGGHRPTVEDVAGRTEWHIRATWAQDTYYLHLQTLKAEYDGQAVDLHVKTLKAEDEGQAVAPEPLEETTPENELCTALSALLPATHRSEDIIARLQRCIEPLQSTQLDQVLAFIDKQWSQKWQAPSDATDQLSDALKQTWFARTFEDTIEEFKQHTEPFEFVPLVCPSSLPDETQASEAKAVAASVSETHLMAINESVETAYANWFAKMPQNIRGDTTMADALKNGWLQDNYYPIVKRIVEQNPDQQCSNSQPPFKRAKTEMGSEEMAQPRKYRLAASGTPTICSPQSA